MTADKILKWATPSLVVVFMAIGSCSFNGLNGRIDRLESRMIRGDDLLRQDINQLREEVREELIYIRQRLDLALTDRVAVSDLGD